LLGAHDSNRLLSRQARPCECRCQRAEVSSSHDHRHCGRTARAEL